MSENAPAGQRFVVCVRNDQELGLALYRIYQARPEAAAERSGWIRIETGEDCL